MIPQKRTEYENVASDQVKPGESTLRTASYLLLLIILPIICYILVTLLIALMFGNSAGNASFGIPFMTIPVYFFAYIIEFGFLIWKKRWDLLVISVIACPSVLLALYSIFIFFVIVILPALTHL